MTTRWWMLFLKWLARVAGVLVAGGFLFMVSGEFFSPHSGPPTQWREWLGIALITIACLSPLLAWKWEMEAAVLSLAALAAWVSIVQFRLDRGGKVVAVMAVPACLFLLDWAVKKTLNKPMQTR